MKSLPHSGAQEPLHTHRAAEKPVVAWQPIETAPRDGTHILIAFGQDHVSAGSYHRNDDDAYPWKFIDSQGDGLPIFNGARDDKYGPTHWSLLPAAPDAVHADTQVGMSPPSGECTQTKDS